MPQSFSRLGAITLTALISFSAFTFRARADEGMFLPDTLSQLSEAKLKQRGLKIPLTDVYNPAGISLKDAVVIVDGGTGEFVSADGLLLTNHHVAFDALVAASDSRHDYATNGYKANSRAEELQAKDYTVTITQDLKDVTAEVLKGVTDDTTPQDRARVVTQNTDRIEATESNEAAGITVRVLPMSEGLSYYKFTYLILTDVRIVYAPPRNIGFFGGDPDNFEWPRHCGDFTFMRAYVGADGKPAEYSANNVPYKPKKFLPLSLGGVKESDFMMVLGYPGTTRRYRESYSVAYNQDLLLPLTVDLFTKQIEALQEAGKSNSDLKIKLQSTIFDLANTLKNDEGSILAMRRANIVGKKQAQEAAFTRWVESDPARKTKYGNVLPSLSKAYDELNANALRDLLVVQIIQASDLLNVAFAVQELAVAKEKPAAGSAAAIGALTARTLERAKATFADRNLIVEREMLIFLLRKAAELPDKQKIPALEKRFGNLQGDARRRAEEDFARSIVDSQKFTTADTAVDLFSLSAEQLRALHEPYIDFATELAPLIDEQQTRTNIFNTTVQRWRPLLLRGMTDMQGTKPYPDANRTLRFSYGSVKGYVPKDAADYQAFTHLSGVLEKDTGRQPFDVPEKLKQLFRARDFGEYGTANRTDVTVDFLTDNDIIGGNSGSPILNGRGEQVGIVFDGNYEGLGNDFFYDGEKGRTISVDIRYVLFVADKFGGAGYLLKELDIRGTPRARGASAGGE
ncbi:MAG TPA: S46 family peptidase [Pyrinomonadaceae bacterium]|nr:S46 family peptidase [Pyrinomonadaceae bacterium]